MNIFQKIVLIVLGLLSISGCSEESRSNNNNDAVNEDKVVPHKNNINNKTNIKNFDYLNHGSISNDILNYYFQFGKKNDFAHKQFFINSDKSNDTGYNIDGYDYLIEDEVLFKFNGSNNSLDWNWKKVNNLSFSTKSEIIVPKKQVSDWSNKLQITAIILDKNWDEIYSYYNIPYEKVVTTPVNSPRQELLKMISHDEDYSNFDTSKIKDMNKLFYEKEVKFDITNWDVSSVTNMSYMFYNSIDFNQDISNWNVSNVHNMNNMFTMATSFNQSISKWDVSSVTDMSLMFSLTHFNKQLDSWDVSSVKNMFSMFSEAVDFNQNIKNWDVSNVINMSFMFYQASSFNQNLTTWDVSKVTDKNSFSNGSKLQDLYKPDFNN